MEDMKGEGTGASGVNIKYTKFDPKKGKRVEARGRRKELHDSTNECGGG